jgi:ubiquinone/menaquinone biosynthesis C-methylase UbiE
MAETGRTYLPAAGYHWSLALYDPLVKLLGGDAARAMLLEQAAVRAAHRVLDIGCGTGSLLVMIKRKYPEAEVVGLDPDPRALARARRKGQRSRIRFQLDQGFADELPYPDESFDRVLSSFMFHHLENSLKVKSLREARRVLKPGGRFHLMDFAKADSVSAGRIARWIHSSPRLNDNSEARLVSLMREAGLSDPKRIGSRSSHAGELAYYQATASG